MLVLEFGLIILTLNLDGANISLLFAFSFIYTLPKKLFSGYANLLQLMELLY